MKRLSLLVLVTLLALAGPTFAADKSAATPDKAPMAAQKASASADRLDLNTATEEELAQLPGIGDARSKAIIKGRWWSVRSLRSRSTTRSKT